MGSRLILLKVGKTFRFTVTAEQRDEGFDNKRTTYVYAEDRTDLL